MIGYFFVESKFVGRKSCPWMSVVPSAALTLKSIGGFQPWAINFVTSADSSVITCVPFASRNTVCGGRSARDQVSTSQRPSGDSCNVWSPSSGVSGTAGVRPVRLVR